MIVIIWLLFSGGIGYAIYDCTGSIWASVTIGLIFASVALCFRGPSASSMG